MSDSLPDELEVLAGARRALGPSAQDQARVLHKARLSIVSGTAPAADAAPAPSAASATVAKHVLSWLVIAGVASWLGYHAGFTAGEQRAFETRRPEPRALLVPPSVAPAPPPIETAAPSEEPASQAVIVADVARRAHANDARRRKTPALDAPIALAAPTASQPNATLDAEIKALRYVERALRNREPYNALARLAQLEREVPQGQMHEERDAARAMARCEERASRGVPDQAEVMQGVLEFSQQYPASVYFARVRQTCLATIDRDAATD